MAQPFRRAVPPPPRGGWKQRASAAAEAEAATARGSQSTLLGSHVDAGQSQLAAYLLLEWAWGSLSGPMLQRIAMMSVADGCSHPDVVLLSKLGASG